MLPEVVICIGQQQIHSRPNVVLPHCLHTTSTGITASCGLLQATLQSVLLICTPCHLTSGPA